MSLAQPVIDALHAKCGFEAVTVDQPSPTQLRLVGRIRNDALGRNLGNFSILENRLLNAALKSEWKLDSSKWKFIKEGTNQTVFAYRLIFSGKNLEAHLPSIIQLISTSPVTSRAELTEVPLYGVGKDRNNTAGGRRGAGVVDTVPTGLAALAVKARGG